MDYKAIARAITDPENQPHQWNEQELAQFFISAADEIERLREALHRISHAPNGKVYCADGHEEAVLIARSAIQQKETER